MQTTFKLYAKPYSVVSSLLLGASLSLYGGAVLAQSTTAAIASARAIEQVQLNVAMVAAQRDLAQFVQDKMRSGAIRDVQDFPFDIAEPTDLADVRIAYGFQLYTIAPQDILAGTGELRNMTQPTGIWRFVVMLRGRPIGLATVEQMDGAWETTEYGGAVLSKAVDAMMTRHANAQRSNVRFIRVYQARSDFLEVVSQQDYRARYAPLQSARTSLTLDQGTPQQGEYDPDGGLVEAAVLMEPLRAAVKSNTGLR